MRALFYCVSMCVALSMLDAAPPGYRPKDDPQPCCTPEQLEFQSAESIVSLLGGNLVESLSNSTVAIDHALQRMASYSTGQTNGQLFRSTTIAEYDTGMMYTIDEILQTCEHSEIPFWMMTEQCVDDNARYTGTFTFGLGTTLDGDAWMTTFHDEGTQSDLDVFLVVSSDTCVPITMSRTLRGQEGPFDMFIGMSFHNMKDSISDPSWFDIPEICDVHTLPSSPLHHELHNEVK